MNEEEATFGIGMSYDYQLKAAQAEVAREKYFNECIRNYQKNILVDKRIRR